MSEPEEWLRSYQVVTCFDCHRVVAYISTFGDEDDRRDVLDRLDHAWEITCFECAAKELNAFCVELHKQNKEKNKEKDAATA